MLKAIFNAVLFNVTVIVLLVISSMSVMAWQVTDFQVKKNGEPVTLVGSGIDYSVDVFFTVTGEFRDPKIDLSPQGVNGFMASGYDSLSITCPADSEDARTCYILSVPMRTSEAVVHVAITAVSGIPPVTEEQVVSSQTFDFDDSMPQLASIRTKYCEDDCRVHSGQNMLTAVIQGSDSPFDNLDVFLKTLPGGSIVRAFRCDGGSCDFLLSDFQCTEGNVVTFNLINSKNDAGRPVFSQGFAVSMECDNTLPEVREVSTSNAYDEHFFRTSDSYRMSAKIYDRSDGVWVRLDLSQLGGEVYEQECIPVAGENHLFDCTLVGALGEVYTVGDAEAYFIDAAGNEEVWSEEVEVLLGGGAGGDLSSDFFSIGVRKVMPDRIVRSHTSMLSKKVYVTLKVSSSNSNARSLSLHDVQCLGSHDGRAYFNPDIEIIDGASTTPMLAMDMLKITMPASVGDQLRMNCSAYITGRKGNQVYDPEFNEFQFAVEFDNAELDMVDRVMAKREESLKEVTDWYADRYQLMKNIDNLVKVCDTAAMIATIQGILGVKSEEVRAGTAGAGEPVAEALDKTGAKTGIVAELTTGTLGKFCAFLTCEYSGPNAIGWQDNLVNFAGSFPGVETMSQATQYGSFENMFDPEASLPAAYIGLCPAAILHNEQKDKAIHCAFLQCIEYEVPNGLPLSECEFTKSYLDCKQKWGAFFSSFPYTVIVRQMLNQVKTALTDPLAMLGLASSMICLADFGPSAAACNIMTAGAHIDEVLRIYNKAVGLYDSFSDLRTQGMIPPCNTIVPEVESRPDGPRQLPPDWFDDDTDVSCWRASALCTKDDISKKGNQLFLQGTATTPETIDAYYTGMNDLQNIHIPAAEIDAQNEQKAIAGNLGTQVPDFFANEDRLKRYDGYGYVYPLANPTDNTFDAMEFEVWQDAHSHNMGVISERQSELRLETERNWEVLADHDITPENAVQHSGKTIPGGEYIDGEYHSWSVSVSEAVALQTELSLVNNDYELGNAIAAERQEYNHLGQESTIRQNAEARLTDEQKAAINSDTGTYLSSSGRSESDVRSDIEDVNQVQAEYYEARGSALDPNAVQQVQGQYHSLDDNVAEALKDQAGVEAEFNTKVEKEYWNLLKDNNKRQELCPGSDDNCIKFRRWAKDQAKDKVRESDPKFADMGKTVGERFGAKMQQLWSNFWTAIGNIFLPEGSTDPGMTWKNYREMWASVNGYSQLSNLFFDDNANNFMSQYRRDLESWYSEHLSSTFFDPDMWETNICDKEFDKEGGFAIVTAGRGQVFQGVHVEGMSSPADDDGSLTDYVMTGAVQMLEQQGRYRVYLKEGGRKHFFLSSQGQEIWVGTAKLRLVLEDSDDHYTHVCVEFIDPIHTLFDHYVDYDHQEFCNTIEEI